MIVGYGFVVVIVRYSSFKKCVFTAKIDEETECRAAMKVIKVVLIVQ